MQILQFHPFTDFMLFGFQWIVGCLLTQVTLKRIAVYLDEVTDQVSFWTPTYLMMTKDLDLSVQLLNGMR